MSIHPSTFRVYYRSDLQWLDPPRRASANLPILKLVCFGTGGRRKIAGAGLPLAVYLGDPLATATLDSQPFSASSVMSEPCPWLLDFGRANNRRPQAEGKD
jgi:hypothetical protein